MPSADLQARSPSHPLLVHERAVFFLEKQSWKVATLQRWLWWAENFGEAFSSVSRGQWISSRCGAVKSVLCPKRLLTVERPPAIRGFFVCAATGFSPAFPPRPFSDTSPRPPQLLPAPQQPAGAGREGSPNPGPLAAAAGGLGAVGGRQSRAAVVSAGGGEKKRPPAPPIRHPREDATSPIPEPSPTTAKPEGTGRPWQSLRARLGRGAGGARGPRRKARPSPSPIGGDQPRGREQGVETGSSPPAPPLSPPGTNREPPRPQRLLPRPGRRDPPRQSLRKKPRPLAGYLRTPSAPRAAASHCRLLRMRDCELGQALPEALSLRPEAVSVPGRLDSVLEKGKEKVRRRSTLRLRHT